MTTLADVMMAHRIERCSVSSPEAAYQWGRCTGCDFESEYVPIKGVNWDELQRDIYVAHVVETVAAAGLVSVLLPEPGGDDSVPEKTWETGSALQVRIFGDDPNRIYVWDTAHPWDRGADPVTAESARQLAAALLAAAAAAEAVVS